MMAEKVSASPADKDYFKKFIIISGRLLQNCCTMKINIPPEVFTRGAFSLYIVLHHFNNTRKYQRRRLHLLNTSRRQTNQKGSVKAPCGYLWLPAAHYTCRGESLRLFRPGGSARFRSRLCPGIGFTEEISAFTKSRTYLFLRESEAFLHPSANFNTAIKKSLKADFCTSDFRVINML
jgi:hypothetical protein